MSTLIRSKLEDNDLQDQKQKAIHLAIQNIEKQFGKGSIMKLGSGLALPEIETISTGSTSLDLALGIGGYPRGRIVEIYGPEASGKTTLTLHAIAEVQKKGGVAVFIDAEHALDLNYAKKLGVKVEDLFISQPDTAEQALNIAEILMSSGGVDLLVIDSVAALVPQLEMAGEMGDTQVGLQARIMSKALRKLTGIIHKTQTLMMFINQIRMKIGVLFGNPETTTGGNALKFFASARLEIRKGAALKDGDQTVGNRTRIKIVKNKFAPPFQETELDVLYGEGISKAGDLLDLSTRMEIIEKSGTWYSYQNERIGQGRENARNYLKAHPQLLDAIQEELLEKAGMKKNKVSKEHPNVLEKQKSSKKEGR